jgi:preprotein translocase subunit SecE
VADKDELDPAEPGPEDVDPTPAVDRAAGGSHVLNDGSSQPLSEDELVEPEGYDLVVGDGPDHALGARAADGTAGEPDGTANAADDSDRDPDETAADRELVSVGAAGAVEAGRGAEPAARSRQKKEKSTPRQKQVVEKDRRTGPVTFLKEAVSELQKVVYPTGQQLVNYFIVVLVFVLFIIAIVSLLDLAFGKAILAIFGS